MKNILLGGFLFALSLLSFGQTATNFNCNDCTGNNHDLFTELNAGKVVVIVWVMPCSSCISGALAAQAACGNYTTSNPGQVLLYIVDDNGNTACSTISSWCTNNGITAANAHFSNAAINMADYGIAGMPKVVVLGDQNHTVYYNQNSPNISTSDINTAIGNALANISIGIDEAGTPAFKAAELFPNPSDKSCQLSLELSGDARISVNLYDISGKNLGVLFDGNLSIGKKTIDINTADLANGNYLVNFSDGKRTRKIRLTVAH